MRCMGILSVCHAVCLYVRSHSVYTRVLIQRMHKTSVQNSHLCVYVSEFDKSSCIGWMHLRTRINQSQYRLL